MSIELENENHELKCIFQKDVVASVIAEMQDKLNATLDTTDDWQALTLDMNAVEKVDSLGINLIVWLFRMTKSADKTFKITGCNPSLLKVFTLFRLHEQFTIEAPVH